MYLYHSSPVEAAVMDSEGRCHRIPPNVPWEVKPQISMDTDKGAALVQNVIPAEKVAQQICADGRFFGLVIVPEIRNGMSINFDVETARKESARIREQAETAIVERYVQHAKEEQLGGRPVKPPSASIQRILDSRKMDLQRDYGIMPVGYKVSEQALARDKKIAEMEAVNAALSQELRDMKEMLNMLIEDKGKKRERQSSPA